MSGEAEHVEVLQRVEELANRIGDMDMKVVQELAGVHTALEGIRASIETLNREVGEVNKVLFRGNGESLLTRVRMLEDGAKRARKEDRVLEDRSFRLKILALAAVFSVVGGLTTAVALHWMGVG